MTEEFYGLNIFGEKVDFTPDQEEEEKKIVSKENEFNLFTLTDAIGERDKRKAWTIYRKAIASGLVPDEIFHRVYWGVRALLLASRCKSAEEAGLNPFVYKKSKSFLNNWKPIELEKLSEDFVLGFHRARRGEVDMGHMIEKILLKL